MTRKLFIKAVMAFAAAAVLLAACKASDTAGNSRADSVAPNTAAKPAQATVPPDGARRITVAELQKMLNDGEAVVYDTRAKASYEQEHIKGALSMPYADVDAHAGELPKDKTLVFYCT
jgi:3-mercaptopyruvate sulfurtransferase SseA